MQSPQASGIARVGGLLLLVSLVLPYFALTFAGFAGKNFHLHELDRTAVYLIIAVALVALAQPRVTNRQSLALIYLIASGLFFAALSYRLWISPPESKSLGDLLGGLGELSVDGQQIEFGDVTIGDMLGAVGAAFKPTSGAWVGTFGGLMFLAGSILEFRDAGASPRPAATTTTRAPIAGTPMAGAPQPYQPPAGTQQPVAPAAAVPPPAPDPFAPPGSVPQPVQPTPPAQPAQTAPPPVDPGAPQRPPGS